MKKTMRFFSLLTVLLVWASGSYAQLVINEFSQGINGTKEYIELVVVGTRTCTDSCADIRGWIIDDNNGWCGAGTGQGIATGCVRFAFNSNWSCVPYGSIILLYNDGDQNPSITQQPDPTDANGDHVYIVPVSSIYMETNNSTPVSPSTPTFVYTSTGFTTGGNWNTLGLRNDGDAVIVTSPGNLTQAYHSFGYGSINNPAGATVYKAQSGAARNYYLTDNQWTNAASWQVGSAPANETPGAPNGTANATWINSMRVPAAGSSVDTNLYACIMQGQSYNFIGQTLTATGVYLHTLTTVAGCDSVLRLHLQVFNPAVSRDTVYGCDQIVLNGAVYIWSTTLSDTQRSVLGCDSAYHFTYLNVLHVTPVTKRDTVKGCGTVTYQGVTYNNRSLLLDTVRTSHGCDSIFHSVYINVYPLPTINLHTLNQEICKGDSVLLSADCVVPLKWLGIGTGDQFWIAPKSNTTYTVVSENEIGCKDTQRVTISVQDFRLVLTAQTPSGLIEEGTPITLETQGSHDYMITRWKPDFLFSAQNAKTQTIPADTGGYYMAVGMSTLGCRDSADVKIKVIPKYPDIFIPTAFTPNGDGVNDFFRPVFQGPFIIVEFNIFNRWGQLVYSSRGGDGRSVGWDGSHNGKQCDLGTYFYSLLAESPMQKQVSMKGEVTLVR